MTVMRTRLPVVGCVLLSAICLASVSSAQAIPTLLHDVETQIMSPGITEPPGLVLVDIRLTNLGDTAALVPRLDVSIRPSGYADFRESIPVWAGGNQIVTLNPWVCPAGSEETCTARITYPEDMNHHNDTDVVIVNSVWQRTYDGRHGSDEGRAVIQTTDYAGYRGYVVAGWTHTNASDIDVYLVKTDGQGDTLWTRTYGGTGIDVGNSVQQIDDDRGYIIVGNTTSFGAGDEDVYLIRTDSLGDTLWTRVYGGTGEDQGNSVEPTADGGFIVAGTTHSFGAGGADVWLLRLNASGDTLWTRTYGGTGDDVGNSVQPTSDGGYIIAGYTSSFGAGGEDVYLIKTNGQGDTLWTRTFGGPDSDLALSVSQTTPDDGYVVAGVTGWSGTGKSEKADAYLVKTNSSGDTLWTRTYGGTGYDAANSVMETNDRGYIIGGVTRSFGAGDEDVYLIRTDSLGDTLWTRTYGGTASDEGCSVQPVMDGSYLIAGYTGSFGAGDSEVYLIKTRGLLDVGPVTILSPPSVADSGTAYVPSAVVRNYGLTSGILPVTMHIGPGYSQTVQETLVSVPLDTVVFPAWTAGPKGSLVVTCFTSLAGDEYPTNDTIREALTVVGPSVNDVGATAILSPSSTAHAGGTVIPKARIQNFGVVAERFFDVQFRIGASYDRTVTDTQTLSPDSTIELTFPPWVAASGTWAVSCSTMLVTDVNRANDKVSSSVQVFAQTLSIEPDQSDQVPAGQSKTYRFYALIQGDTGGVVELKQPSPPPGWNLRLRDSADAHELVDKDGDGIPDLGFVAPGESCCFSLDVTAPSGLAGDTASLASRTFLIAGHLGSDSLVADTAVLNLTLVPAFSVHNFPNPFSDHTAFVIGLPDDGKVTLTVYTRTGERVCRVLENADMPAGVHVVRWDRVNDNGRAVAPGTYEYVLDYEHADKTDRINKKLVVTGK